MNATAVFLYTHDSAWAVSCAPPPPPARLPYGEASIPTTSINEQKPLSNKNRFSSKIAWRGRHQHSRCPLLGGIGHSSSTSRRPQTSNCRVVATGLGMGWGGSKARGGPGIDQLNHGHKYVRRMKSILCTRSTIDQDLTTHHLGPLEDIHRGDILVSGDHRQNNRPLLLQKPEKKQKGCQSSRRIRHNPGEGEQAGANKAFVHQQSNHINQASRKLAASSSDSAPHVTVTGYKYPPRQAPRPGQDFLVEYVCEGVKIYITPRRNTKNITICIRHATRLSPSHL